MQSVSVLKVPKNHGASFRINKCKPAANIYYVEGHISELVSEIPRYKEYVCYVAMCTSVASGFFGLLPWALQCAYTAALCVIPFFAWINK